METFSALPDLRDGKPPVTGGFPSQRVGNADFDVFFYVSLNKWLNKPSSCWRFETPWCSLWRHCIGIWVKFTMHQITKQNMARSESTIRGMHSSNRINVAIVWDVMKYWVVTDYFLQDWLTTRVIKYNFLYWQRGWTSIFKSMFTFLSIRTHWYRQYYICRYHL